jgi:hypothetical protein
MIIAKVTNFKPFKLMESCVVAYGYVARTDSIFTSGLHIISDSLAQRDLVNDKNTYKLDCQLLSSKSEACLAHFFFYEILVESMFLRRLTL